MKKQVLMSITLIAVGIFLLGMASVAFAGHEIVGAPKCKSCHKSKTGDQWAKWEGSKHAGAFATLGTDAAKKIATEKGLGDPQTEEACLKCHVTQAFLGRDVVINVKNKYLDSEGVGCLEAGRRDRRNQRIDGRERSGLGARRGDGRFER